MEDMTYQDQQWAEFLDRVEGYCDYCDQEGHDFRHCPKRDDETTQWGDC